MNVFFHVVINFLFILVILRLVLDAAQSLAIEVNLFFIDLAFLIGILEFNEWDFVRISTPRTSFFTVSPLFDFSI
jgi:hypothetical protein